MYFMIPGLNPLDAVDTYILRVGIRSVEKSLPNEESTWVGSKQALVSINVLAKDARGGDKVMDRHGCTSKSVFCFINGEISICEIPESVACV